MLIVFVWGDLRSSGSSWTGIRWRAVEECEKGDLECKTSNNASDESTRRLTRHVSGFDRHEDTQGPCGVIRISTPPPKPKALCSFDRIGAVELGGFQHYSGSGQVYTTASEREQLDESFAASRDSESTEQYQPKILSWMRTLPIPIPRSCQHFCCTIWKHCLVWEIVCVEFTSLLRLGKTMCDVISIKLQMCSLCLPNTKIAAFHRNPLITADPQSIRNGQQFNGRSPSLGLIPASYFSITTS